MSGWSELDRFLRTDARDVGCAEAIRMLHVYVDTATDDPPGAAARYPGLAAHLAACEPCEDDYLGLRAAVAGKDTP